MTEQTKVAYFYPKPRVSYRLNREVFISRVQMKWEVNNTEHPTESLPTDGQTLVDWIARKKILFVDDRRHSVHSRTRPLPLSCFCATELNDSVFTVTPYWAEDVMNVLRELTDPAQRNLYAHSWYFIRKTGFDVDSWHVFAVFASAGREQMVEASIGDGVMTNQGSVPADLFLPWDSSYADWVRDARLTPRLRRFYESKQGEYHDIVLTAQDVRTPFGAKALRRTTWANTALITEDLAQARQEITRLHKRLTWMLGMILLLTCFVLWKLTSQAALFHSVLRQNPALRVAEDQFDQMESTPALGETSTEAQNNVTAGEPLTLQEEFDEWMRQQQNEEPPTLQEEFDEWMQQQQN